MSTPTDYTTQRKRETRVPATTTYTHVEYLSSLINNQHDIRAEVTDKPLLSRHLYTFLSEKPCVIPSRVHNAAVISL